MRLLPLLKSLALAFSPYAAAQVCAGDVDLDTQTEVDVFSCTEVTGSLSVNQLQDGQIGDIDGLAELERVGGDFYLGGTGTADLDALSALRSVGGFFEIAGHPSLTDVSGLAALESVGDFLFFTSNEQLVEIDGIDALHTVGTDIGALFNPALERFLGFESLRTVGEDIGFYDNPRLVDLTGLSGLSRVPGLILIQENDALENVDALTGIEEVGNHVSIAFNASLRDVDGLQNVARTGALFIRDNPLLQSCACGVGRMLAEGDVSGKVRVESNAPDGHCNSPEDLLEAYKMGDACDIDTSTEEGPEHHAFQLAAYPNPATDAVTLRFAVAEQAEATLVVYDALGREVARPVEGAVSGVVEASLATADLPAGLYVARLTVGGHTETVRLSVVR